MKVTTRRQVLIEQMNFLESNGMGCAGCSGTCCTYEANSMLITPTEAIELIQFLIKENMLNDDLKVKLSDTIKKYRLMPKYPNERSYLRKTYTCPFFHHKEFGCPLPREIKPYGCLAFNSHHPEIKNSEQCFSEVELLKQRQDDHPEEDTLNEKYRKDLGLNWQKAPIPNAILELWEKFSFFHQGLD